MRKKTKSSVSSLMERTRKIFINPQKNLKQDKSLEEFLEYPMDSLKDSNRLSGKLLKGLNTTKRLRN
jgi:hypothetical protein